MSRKKVTVVGGGFVGSTTAQRIVDLELADVVLTDILDGPPAGKALDMMESGPITRTDSRATGVSTATGDYSATARSDVVVITAGFPRKPGMSRDDLLKANYDVVKAVVEQIVKHSPNCIIIVVTNPLDAMAQAALKVSGFPKHRVHMSTFVAMECKVSVENVHSFVLGGHGDDMVPLPRYSTVAGIPLPDLLPKERIDAIVERTRKGGAEIVNLLKTGSAYYAPSAAAVEMVEAILKDKKKILPCAVYLDGEYGIKGLFVGVPVKLGAKGVEEIIQIKLTAEENAALQKSSSSVRERCQFSLPTEDFPRAVYQSQCKSCDHHLADGADRERTEPLLAHIAEIGAQADPRKSEQKRPARKIGERSDLLLAKEVIGRKDRNQQEA